MTAKPARSKINLAQLQKEKKMTEGDWAGEGVYTNTR